MPWWTCAACREQHELGDLETLPCGNCPWAALTREDQRVVESYRWLASGLCQDAPGLTEVALEILGLSGTMTRAEARTWFEGLMLYHGGVIKAQHILAERERRPG